MEDDLIVVDDIDVETQPSASAPLNGASSSSKPPQISQRALPERASAARLRSGSTMHSPAVDNSERATRSTAMRPKAQPKLKLKLSEKAAAQAPGMSFLGPYDRELDSDEEDLGFEEQFILRLPPGEDLDKLRKMVQAREVANDVWFKFKDSRRAVFHIGNSTYSAKLVDLPCIIESQKTLDNKQMFKVADICQMLVAENKIENDEHVGAQKSNFNIDEFIWPHGITPPLHYARKRRFRKRVNRRTIESVEEQVERLLDEDALALEVKYEVLENVNPDLSDSEFIEREPLDAPTPAISDLGDAATPREDLGEGEEDEDEENEDEMEGDIDEELAAELDLALGDEDDGGNEDDEDDESEEEDSEDDDDEDAQARKLLNEEIRDLEIAVAKKNNEITSSANPLIRKRFEDALKKLTADLEMKLGQRDELKEKQRIKKEGISMNAAEDTDPETAGDQDGEGGGREDDDLFGSDEPAAMEIT